MAEHHAPYVTDEYRVIFRTPSSIIDTDSDRANGYVTRETKAYPTIKEAKAEALKSSEETHASIIRVETRTVMIGGWRG